MYNAFPNVAATRIQRTFRRTRLMANPADNAVLITALGADLATTKVSLKKSQRQDYDITKSLGLDREKKAYNTRLEALTAPATYATNRTAKWDAMTIAIKEYFESTVD